MAAASKSRRVVKSAVSFCSKYEKAANNENVSVKFGVSASASATESTIETSVKDLPKVPSPDLAEVVEYMKKYGMVCGGVLTAVGAGGIMHGLGKKKSSLTECSSLKAASDNLLAPILTRTKVEALLDSVKWDDEGLAVAIAQNIDTGAVLMQGFANKEALATTISSRKATFYSRSRSSLWTKGETSTNFINVHDIFLDCDRDSIIYLGKPDGPTCHTGSETCYFLSVFDLLNDPQAAQNRSLFTTLYLLESTITQRQAEVEAMENGKPSWTKLLLSDSKLLCSKIREEANELCQTLEDNEERSRTASEMADVLYHAMVLLRVRDVKLEEVIEVLRKRFSQSGVEEKKNRKSGNQS